MTRRKRIVVLVVFAVLAVVAYFAFRLALGRPFTLNQLANRQVLYFVLDDPEFLTRLGMIDGTILDLHSDEWTELSVARRDQTLARLKRYREEVHSFGRDGLEGQDAITWDVLDHFYSSQALFEEFTWLTSEGLYPLNQFNGVHTTGPRFLESQHVIRNAKTARHYVARVEKLPAKLDQAAAETRRQADRGVIPPSFLFDKIVAGMKAISDGDPRNNALYTNFVEKIGKLPEGERLGEEDRTRLEKRVLEAVRTGVIPAYQRLVAQMEELRPRAAPEAGVWRLPAGDRYYAQVLREETTTDLTADQVHDVGTREVERITAEMDAILDAQGLSDGGVGERMRKLASDPRFQFPDSAEGREEILSGYRAILGDMERRAPEFFATLPPQDLVVERVPAFAETGGGGAYYEPPAFDGSRPGKFFANLRDVRETPKWTMKSLAYHEGIPGHHFQIAIAMNLEGLPLLRKLSPYTAYVEGWALYAERLAAEMGIYRDDPFGDLGRLQAEIFRAARLVVDTGLHAKRWSRDQAVGYMSTVTGMVQTDVETEIDRYVIMPGQACAYKLGQLKILELRERARQALADQFDLKAFHALILEDGALPLTVLERQVDAWIAERRGGSI